MQSSTFPTASGVVPSTLLRNPPYSSRKVALTVRVFLGCKQDRPSSLSTVIPPATISTRPRRTTGSGTSSNPPAPIEETFAREEIIPVKCNVHPWMKGYIAVFKHPYFAITDKDGTFDLKNVPPGDYTIEAWHEKYGVLTQKVAVEPN